MLKNSDVLSPFRRFSPGIAVWNNKLPLLLENLNSHLNCFLSGMLYGNVAKTMMTLCIEYLNN